MATLLIALGAGIAFLVAYHTYGRWLGRRVFNLAADAVCPSARLRDDQDYVPTSKAIVFGHHFTSIAGTGPIVGPAIAVMWGWLPALLWVVLGSIFIGAVHDFGSLVVSLRNNGQTVGDIAGRVLNKRVRLLFLLVLFMALTIVLAIFGLVIAAVFKQYPATIVPCLIQIPIAVSIGVYLHRRGKNLFVPSLLALGVMYLTVIFGDTGFLHTINAYLASLSIITWVIILLLYSYVASVLPVWGLLQPRDYINSLQLLTALGLIVIGLFVAAFIGGAPPVEGADRQPLEIVAPMFNPNPEGAPMIYPFLFITIACGAISGFHCLVSSGTSSKQLKKETDAQFVGYGSMVTEGFLATLVILCCVAGLGLSEFAAIGHIAPPDHSVRVPYIDSQGRKVEAVSIVPFGDEALGQRRASRKYRGEELFHDERIRIQAISPDHELDWRDDFSWSLNKGNWNPADNEVSERVELTPNTQAAWWGSGTDYSGHQGLAVYLNGTAAWNNRYASWAAAGSLGAKVSAFVDGAANFLKSFGVPAGIAVALMGVLVASFAGTTLDTACRLQRYVVQELAGTFIRRPGPNDCFDCGYDLTANVTGTCPECGAEIKGGEPGRAGPDRGDTPRLTGENSLNPLRLLTNKHGATIFAIVIAAAMAAMPVPGSEWAWANAGKGGLILWPMFGATNQLLGGLAFLVITFWLWRRGKPIWFVALPLVFMLIMPAWAMLIQIPEWLDADQKNWALIGIAVATIALELWMIVEAVLLFPKVKGLIESDGSAVVGGG